MNSLSNPNIATHISSPKTKLKLGQIIWVVILVGLLAYLSWLARYWLEEQNAALDILPTTPGCDLRQSACTAAQGKQLIRLTIDSEQITSHLPLDFGVELSGIDAEKINILLQGKDMFMGQNVFSLTRQADGSFQGQGQLPVCTTGMMTWQALVRINIGNDDIGAVFEFDAK